MQSTSSVATQILENFKESKEYRHAFLEETVRAHIAAQIKAIREQQEITRPALARIMDKSPSWVFRLEDPNAAPPTISTLLQVAMALDVGLEVNFSPFSKLLSRLDALIDLSVPSFDDRTGRA